MAAPQNVEFPRLKSLADYEKWESKVYDHVIEMRNGGPGRGYGRFQVPPLLDRLPEYFASQIRLWPDYISGVLSSDTVLWQLGDAWRRCNCLREYVSKTKSELWEKYLVDPQLICCEECRALRAAVLTVVSEELGDATPETLTVHQGFDYMKGGNGYEIALLDGSDRELLRFDVLESRTERPRPAGMSPSQPVYPRIHSARWWLKSCVKLHKCQTASTFTPRRLVQIGDGNADVRLVDMFEEAREDSPIAYAALSYVWGTSNDTLTTTRENIDDHKRQLPFERLPMTIQDAILLCRGLLIPWLWVDGLCIVQRDLEDHDWNEESAKMSQIYFNAHLTISAEDTPASNVGFDQLFRNPFRTLPGQKEGTEFGVWMRGTQSQTTSEDILSTRAWTLQERILSNRVLRFRSSGMEWECNNCILRESRALVPDLQSLTFRAIRLSGGAVGHGSFTRRRPDGEARWDNSIGEKAIHVSYFLISSSPASIYYAWYAVVENYSRRAMTSVTDKLSAISGLVRFLADCRKLGPEDYLAGLWRGDIAGGLLWYTVPSKPEDDHYRHTDQYIAPSWSWASLNGPIAYFHEQYQFPLDIRINFVHGECYPVSTDRYGRVRFGAITLRGTLTPVDLLVLPYDPEICPSDYTGGIGCAPRAHPEQLVLISNAIPDKNTRRSWYEILPDVAMEYDTPETIEPFRLEPGKKMPWKSPQDTGGGSDETKHFCLSIGEMVDRQSHGRRHWWLVLEQAGEEEAPVYRRVGVGYFQYLRRPFQLFGFDETNVVTIL